MEKQREGTEEEREEKYPWHLLRRTVLLLNVFLGKSLIFLFSSAHLKPSSVRVKFRNNWTHSLGPEGPRGSHHWTDLLHTDAENYRITGWLFLCELLVGQTAPVSISHPSRLKRCSYQNIPSHLLGKV